VTFKARLGRGKIKKKNASRTLSLRYVDIQEQTFDTQYAIMRFNPAL
jgi:hypothetical protein